jgi:photosystem II stability/assembly factor-like uncharacterized protein
MWKKTFLVWVILAVALLPAGCARHTASQQKPAQSVASKSQPNAKGVLPLLSVQMYNATTGWASTNNDVLRTTDGGYHWQVVTPQIDRGESIGMMDDFVNADQACVAFGQRAETKAVALVFHTTDGGATWRRTEIPLSSSDRQFCWGAVTFTDGQHGWLMAVNSQHDSPAELFATTDGGTTWPQIASTDDANLPCGGKINFRDPSTGWTVGNLGGNGSSPSILFRTQDGGHTWREQALKLPPCYPKSTIGLGNPPVFFSGGEGMLMATYWPEPQSPNETLLYFTQDGGQTWQSRPPLNPWGIVDFLNANEGWYWPWEPPGSPTAPPGAPVKGKLYRTTDGCMTWTGIEPDQTLKTFLDQGLNITQLDFIDSRTGWVLLSFNEKLQLLKTADGGGHWTTAYPN